mmetsp:Transcript_105830/g.192972  ORF Transcript_105830/g.192972 Transcript_105830/m.192972 type:complete len:286 (-) Transcript_105830:144-1001(-)
MLVDGSQDSRASSARRPRSSGSASGSLTARYKRLEENVLQNLNMLNTHRVEMENVVQLRKERAKKAAQELSGGSESLSSPLSSRGRSLGIPSPCFQSMKSRIAALEENADLNQESMKEHRSILDTVNRAKQDAPARTGVQDEAVDTKAPLLDRAQMIEANARRISARLQESSSDKNMNGSQRPASAPTGRSPGMISTPTRPGSACQGAPGRVSPEAALERAIRGNTSRPCTPNTLLARCRALENNLMRNKQTLWSNRTTLDEITKRRKQEASVAMTQSGKTAMRR